MPQMHYISAGDVASGQLILLLHGFPELSYSWRKVMPLLAAQGFWCVAVDVPGYGKSPAPDSGAYSSNASKGTAMEEVSYDQDVTPWCRSHLSKLLADFIKQLCEEHNRESYVHCLIGHDMGSPQAGVLALLYPDLFAKVVCMSAPWTGVAQVPQSVRSDMPTLKQKANTFGRHLPQDAVDRENEHQAAKCLAELAQEGYKHYQHHYCEPEAASSFRCDGDSSISFEHALRCYYYLKSGHSWMLPHSLDKTWNPASVKELPGYYLLPKGVDTMQDYLTQTIQSPERREELSLENLESEMSGWLSKTDLQVYLDAYRSTGFQSSLNYYRSMNAILDSAMVTEALDGQSDGQLSMPLLFIAGAMDWGIYQNPGAFEAMQARGTQCVLIEGAGHWVQQEKPDEVVNAILTFMRS